MKLKSYLLLVAAVAGQAMPPTPTLISMPPMPTSTGAIKTPKIAPPPMPTTFDLLDPDFNLDDLDKAMKDLDQLDAALKDLDTAMKDLASLNNTGDFNITSSFNTTIPDSIDEDEVDIGLIIETMMKVEGLMERIDPKDVASLDIKGKTNSEIIALATEKFGEKDPIVEVLTALDDIDMPLAEYINKMEIPEKEVSPKNNTTDPVEPKLDDDDEVDDEDDENADDEKDDYDYSEPEMNSTHVHNNKSEDISSYSYDDYSYSYNYTYAPSYYSYSYNPSYYSSYNYTNSSKTNDTSYVYSASYSYYTMYSSYNPTYSYYYYAYYDKGNGYYDYYSVYTDYNYYSYSYTYSYVDNGSSYYSYNSDDSYNYYYGSYTKKAPYSYYADTLNYTNSISTSDFKYQSSSNDTVSRMMVKFLDYFNYALVEFNDVSGSNSTKGCSEECGRGEWESMCCATVEMENNDGTKNIMYQCMDTFVADNEIAVKIDDFNVFLTCDSDNNPTTRSAAKFMAAGTIGMLALATLFI